MRSFALALVALLFASTFAGCHSPDQKPPDTVPSSGATSTVAPPPATGSLFPRTLTDARGKTLTLKTAPAHIVSLAPSLTEVVYALGIGKKLAADTLSCDYPPEAKSLPHVDPLSGDRERIEVQSPDLVLAMEKIDPAPLIAALEKDGISVLVVKGDNLEQTYQSIKLVGYATGQEEAASRLAQEMQAKIEAVKKTVAAAADKPGVLMMYSDNPVYTTPPDSFISDVIGIAGGQNIVTEPLPNGVLSPEKVVERQPEVIICSSALMPKVKLLPGWNVVPAVANNRFFQTSNKTTLVRPGPRLPLAAEELARYLHPDLFKQNAPPIPPQP